MTLLGLVTISRIGSYIPVSSQIDTVAFSEALGSSGGLTGYEDIFLGSSLSKVGVFSLGIIPNINASIIMQFLSYAFPNLKKLQKDEGPAGRRNFSLYQKLVTLVLALVQAVGELTFIKCLMQVCVLVRLSMLFFDELFTCLMLLWNKNEIDKLRF
jgi:preprotein translocase subunit SecY